MTEHTRLINIIKDGIGGLLPKHIADQIAPKMADRLIKEGAIFPPCKVGDTVYVIERDVDGFADTISGYVFLAQTDNVVIVSCFINDYDVKGIISHHIIETAEDYGTDLAVFPREDMFLAKEEAEAALKEEKNK